MIRFTDNTLKKMELLLKEAGYQVRSGKGAFNSGYCILETKKVVVLNKYHSVEARINSLIEIINRLPIDATTLDKPLQKLHQAVTTYEAAN